MISRAVGCRRTRESVTTPVPAPTSTIASNASTPSAMASARQRDEGATAPTVAGLLNHCLRKLRFIRRRNTTCPVVMQVGKPLRAYQELVNAKQTERLQICNEDFLFRD